MAEVVFTEEETQRIEEIMRDLDPAQHELTQPFEAKVPPGFWNAFVDYARSQLRAAIEIEHLMRAVAATALARGLVDEEGLSHFLAREEITEWALPNFGQMDKAGWRWLALQELCEEVDVDRFLDAIQGLIEIGRSRMFETLDDDLRNLV